VLVTIPLTMPNDYYMGKLSKVKSVKALTYQELLGVMQDGR